MTDVASTRVLNEMFWDRDFARRVYAGLTPDVFEGRAAIASVIADHDARRPDAPGVGVERVLSIMGVFHEHAARQAGWWRSMRQWKEQGSRGEPPVAPYRSLTPVKRGEIDPMFLARAGTMLITGEVAAAVTLEDRVATVRPQVALSHLIARRGPGAGPGLALVSSSFGSHEPLAAHGRDAPGM